MCPIVTKYIVLIFVSSLECNEVHMNAWPFVLQYVIFKNLQDIRRFI